MRKYKNLLISLAVFIINASIGSVFFYVNEQSYQMEQRALVTTVGTEYANTLEKQLDRSLSSTYALAALIRQNGSIANFDALAADIIENYGGISSLQLAPNAVVSQIYPLAGNETAIGHDLLNDPNRRADTLATIENRALTLAGPIQLIQGGTAVIGRYPVFLSGESPDKFFWGFTIALIRLDNLLETSGFNAALLSDYDYELGYEMPATGAREIFFQTTTTPLSDPINIDIEIPNGVWTLSLTPTGGWTSSPTISLGIGGIILSSFLLSIFVNYLLRQPEALQKLAEDSEKKFRAITNQSSEGIAVSDLDGNYVFVNPAFSEMMGYSEKELLRMTVFDLRGKTQKTVFEQSKKTKVDMPLEVVLRRKDDTEFVSEILGKTIEFNGNQSVLGTVRDITERKQAEEQIELQSAALESAANAIVITDAAGDILWVNSAFSALTGYSWQEVLGKNPDFLRTENQDENIFINMWETINAGKPWRGEIVNRRKNGEHYNEEMTIAPLLSEDGKVKNFIAIKQDITERKQAEEQIELQSAALESAANAIVITNAVGNILWVNTAFNELTGYSSEEAIGQNPRMLKSGKQGDAEYKAMWNTINAGEVWHGEVINKRKDGTLYDEEMTIAPLLSEDGKVKNFIAIKQDISERKRSEMELRESKEKFETAIIKSPIPMVITGENQDIVLYNNKFTELFGYTLADISTAEDWWRAVYPDPDYRKLVEESWTTAIQNAEEFGGEIAMQEWDMHTKDGAVRRVEFKMTRLGEISLIALNDITERKQIEAILLENVSRYYQMFEGNQAIKIIVDPESGKIVEANQAAQDFYGYDMETFATLDVSDINILPKEEVEQALQHAKTQERLFFNFRHKLASGEIRDVEVYTGPVKIEKKVLLYSIIHDVTERKKAEEKILQLNKELEQRVHERTAELSATIEEIEGFSYSVSHDLRAPLRAISGFSDILIKDFSEDLNDEIKDYLLKMNTASQDMDELITGLLFLSRLSREKLSLIPFSPKDMIDQIFETVQESQTHRDIVFTAQACPEITADPKLMKILLTNLLSNAIKFTKEKHTASIEFGTMTQDGRIVFFLRDNGIGFNMAYADKIFTPFQRLHSREKFEGTGIGLAIAYRVIQRHRGDIWVESEEGKGTTLYFTIGALQDKQKNQK